MLPTTCYGNQKQPLNKTGLKNRVRIVTHSKISGQEPEREEIKSASEGGVVQWVEGTFFFPWKNKVLGGSNGSY